MVTGARMHKERPTPERAPYVPEHYVRRVARSIVLRAALRGRLSWHVALPLLNNLGGHEVQR